MPDSQASIGKLLRDVRQACIMHEEALCNLKIEYAIIIDLRQGVELSIDKLQTVRDWLDERLR